MTPDRPQVTAVCRMAALSIALALHSAARDAAATEVLFAVDGSRGEVLRFDANVGTFLGVHSDRREISPSLNLAHVTGGPDGLLYLGTGGIDGVARLDPRASNSLTWFAGDGGGALANTSSPRPVFGPDGDLFVHSDRRDTILRYDGTDGTFQGVIVADATRGIGTARDLAVNQDGDLLVLVQGPQDPADPPIPNNVVLRFDGVTGAFSGELVPSGFVASAEMVIGPDGLLYVSNLAGKSIDRFDATTAAFVDRFARLDELFPSVARDMAFRADGDLLVSGGFDPDGARIFHFDGETGELVAALVVADDTDSLNILGLELVDFDVLVVDNIPDNVVHLGRPGESVVQQLVLAGDVDVRIRDEATVILESAQQYTGETVVGGMFINNAGIAGDARVLENGTLGGTGVFRNVFADAGTVAPGASIGTMTVDGDLVLSSSATLEIELDAAGRSDRVIVSGAVDLGDALLSVVAEDGEYAVTRDYFIIDNDGVDPVRGDFSSIDIDLLFLSASITTTGGDGNDVVLTLLRNDVRIEAAAMDRNQRGVAAILGDELLSGNADPGTLAGSILLLPESQATLTLASTNGEIVPNVTNVLDAGNDAMLHAVARRTSSTRASMAGVTTTPTLGSAGAAGDAVLPGPADRSVWVSAIGGFGRTSRDHHGSGTDFDYRGFVVGVDIRSDVDVRYGVFFGHLSHDTEIRSRVDDIDIDSFGIGAYSYLSCRNAYVTMLASFSVDDYDLSRRATVGSAVSELSAEYDGSQFSAFVEGGLRWTWFRMSVEPSLAFRYYKLRRDGFREAGDPTFALTWASDTYDNFSSTVGISISRGFDMRHVRVVPELNVGWGHKWEPTYAKQDARFTGFGDTFEVRSPEIARNSAIVRISAPAHLNRFVSASAEYSGRFFAGGASHAAGVTFTVAW